MSECWHPALRPEERTALSTLFAVKDRFTVLDLSMCPWGYTEDDLAAALKTGAVRMPSGMVLASATAFNAAKVIENGLRLSESDRARRSTTSSSGSASTTLRRSRRSRRNWGPPSATRSPPRRSGLSAKTVKTILGFGVDPVVERGEGLSSLNRARVAPRGRRRQLGTPKVARHAMVAPRSKVRRQAAGRARGVRVVFAALDVGDRVVANPRVDGTDLCAVERTCSLKLLPRRRRDASRGLSTSRDEAPAASPRPVPRTIHEQRRGTRGVAATRPADCPRGTRGVAATLRPGPIPARSPDGRPEDVGPDVDGPVTRLAEPRREGRRAVEARGVRGALAGDEHDADLRGNRPHGRVERRRNADGMSRNTSAPPRVRPTPSSESSSSRPSIFVRSARLVALGISTSRSVASPRSAPTMHLEGPATFRDRPAAERPGTRPRTPRRPRRSPGTAARTPRPAASTAPPPRRAAARPRPTLLGCCASRS